MNQKKTKTHHLGRKVSCLVISLLAISIAAVAGLCIYMFYGLVLTIMENHCTNGTDILAYELEDIGMDDKTELLDELKERMGCEFTIFVGDLRAYTTIQQNGERATGTKLSEELAEIVLVQGKPYVGTTEIMGVKHICSYAPTFDRNGKIKGLLFCGISMADAFAQINKTIFLSCGAGVVLILLSGLAVSFFITRSVSSPLSRLTRLAQTMEEGNLGLGQEQALCTGIRSKDEIGLLADIFENTILRLRNYIGEISTILESISLGNLTATTTQDYVGDFTSIKASLDNILGKLNDTMSQIIESSESVSSGSRQMSIGAQSLSQGAVEQSSAVEELESTIGGISQQVSRTAEHAQQASLKVTAVSSNLLESNQKMQEMIHAMEEISNSSNEIVKIIHTIDTIAQQTNILALNSSVEASRAGEYGKGFAVIAKEVRELAGQSSEASKSTNGLIERSIQAVEYGTKIANETATQLASVVEGTKEVVETTNWIAEAARSQSESVSQIQERIQQISNVVQTNSATAQESAATSQELSSQAGLLKSLIGMFHLKAK